MTCGEGRQWQDVAETYTPGKTNFIQVRGLSDTAVVSDICDHFGIGLLIQQDILNVNHAAKIEQHDGKRDEDHAQRNRAERTPEHALQALFVRQIAASERNNDRIVAAEENVDHDDLTDGTPMKINQ